MKTKPKKPRPTIRDIIEGELQCLQHSAARMRSYDAAVLAAQNGWFEQAMTYMFEALVQHDERREAWDRVDAMMRRLSKADKKLCWEMLL